MNTAVAKTNSKTKTKAKSSKKDKITLKLLMKQKYLLLMSVPFVIWAIIFKYIPLWGWTMAFQDYKPAKSFTEQSWVGLKHFKALFSEPEFFLALRNTLAMSILGLVFGLVASVGFAILLNEMRNARHKKIVQTISYLPHFVSWVIVASIVTTVLSPTGGVINELLVKLHIIDAPRNFLTEPQSFWGIVTITDIWKEMGWNAIIYLAAMTSIDPELYEAAKVDGANRLKRIWHITLPGIRPTIIILLILSIGSILNIGFEKQFLLGNPMVKDYSLVLDWYALDYGIGMFRYSYGTAIGMFKSLVSIILLLFANGAASKWGESKLV